MGRRCKPAARKHGRTTQSNPRVDLPAPKVGDTFKPGNDWTKWYPEHVVMPGIQAEDKVWR